MNTTESKRKFRVTRRGLLIGTGVASAGLVVGAVLGRNPFYRMVAGLMSEGNYPGGGETDPTVWFELLPSDKVRIIIPKVEMGQGAHTAMTQIAAEELGARWDQFEVIQGNTELGPSDRGTVGSTSISTSFQPLRRAAANMRQLLINAASERLGIPAADLHAADGVVRARDATGQLSYGEIVAGVEEWKELELEPELKATDKFTFIGQSLQRVDVEAKLRGEAVYGYDLSKEGMLYGAVARPPTVEGRMVSARPGTAENSPGVAKVVIDADDQFAGVAANTRQQAINALDALDIEWDRGPKWSQADIDALLDVSDGAGIPIQKNGRPLDIIGHSPSLRAEYSSPFAIHAHLEPEAALADVHSDRAEIWVSTQMHSQVQTLVASDLNMDAGSVKVTSAYLGGGFGGKTGFGAAREAARLSRSVGRPVHIGLTRPEDMRHGWYRPPTRSRFSAVVENGKILALNHNHASGEVLFSFFPKQMSILLGSDPGAWRGAYNFYDSIQHRQLNSLTVKLPVPTGAWRGLGLLANAYACESFMDEMAHAAAADPLQFRLDHLGTDAFAERMRNVLLTTADRAAYGNALPEGHAMGIACTVDVDTVAALCAEVSVESDGTIVVHRMVQALDPGLVVNPDGALAQAEGSITMALSSTLIEEMTVKDGVVKPGNFDSYPLITMDRTPDIEVVFLESDGRPRGMGEPAVGPVAAAVGNAFFNLTGTRLRNIPFTKARVRAALDA
jgi:isoquinoline 1-oxidoreductase beta subunit|tara:strand:+ start:9214 stop:11409 length:2196 start_codon:yes stop_codon:yes gene_type:complete